MIKAWMMNIMHIIRAETIRGVIWVTQLENDKDASRMFIKKANKIYWLEVRSELCSLMMTKKNASKEGYRSTWFMIFD